MRPLTKLRIEQRKLENQLVFQLQLKCCTRTELLELCESILKARKAFDDACMTEIELQNQMRFNALNERLNEGDVTKTDRLFYVQ